MVRSEIVSKCWRGGKRQSVSAPRKRERRVDDHGPVAGGKEVNAHINRSK